MKKGSKKSTGKKVAIENIIFPLLTLVCLAGFIGSLIFPNEVLDTYEVNMREEEGKPEVLLPLSYDKPIVYEVDTKGRELQGLQLGINKRGMAQRGRILCVKVFSDGTLVSQHMYDIAGGDDLQYVYLPFEDPKKCVGHLSAELTLIVQDGASSVDTAPALMANFTEVPDTATIISEEQAVLPVPGSMDGDGNNDNDDMAAGSDDEVSDGKNDIEGIGRNNDVSGNMTYSIGELLADNTLSLKGYHIYSPGSIILFPDVCFCTPVRRRAGI